MPDRFIDPDDARPVYVRIAEELRKAYQPGTQLPTVPVLADEWGVAKETVRTAIDVLRKEGLIVSWQGRGTFYRVKIDDTPDLPEIPGLREYLENMMNHVHDLEARVVKLENRDQP